MNRRSFMGTLLAAAMAPAIVRAQSLMPVRNLAHAPSSSAAIMDYWLKQGYDASGMLDAARYSLGMLEIMSDDGRLLGSMPVGGKLVNGGRLIVQPGRIDQSGRFAEAFCNLPGIGRFKIDHSHVGTQLQPGYEVVCHDGLHVTADMAAEQIAAGLVPGLIISAQ